MTIHVVLALAADPATTAQLADHTRTSRTQVDEHLAVLATTGLATHTDHTWSLAVSVPEAVSRLIGQKRGDPRDGPSPCNPENQHPLEEAP
ncbi:Uncharacterised protein [Mycobacteroides abscessus subsp. abscessus]|nr:Uncharacterised protein [Mycobacteroides abscessus subsp. abscessus]